MAAQPAAYVELCKLLREAAHLASVAALVNWDQETYMPARALAFRANQMSWLSGKAHALASGSMMQKLLARAGLAFPDALACRFRCSLLAR